jgi:hypothetical protein
MIDKNKGSSFKNSMIEDTRDCTMVKSRNLMESLGGLYCDQGKNSMASVEVLGGDLEDQEYWVGSSGKREDFDQKLNYKS